MTTQIESIISDLRTAIRQAESDLRVAKVIPMPPQRGWTNAQEAKSWVANALAYSKGGPKNFDVLVSSLERINKLLEDPAGIHEGGPHK